MQKLIINSNKKNNKINLTLIPESIMPNTHNYAMSLCFFPYSRVNMRCKLCKLTHPFIYCPAFAMLSPEKRREVLARFQHCINCFRGSHATDHCPNPERCPYCEKKHNAMVHLDTAPTRWGPADARSVYPLLEVVVSHGDRRRVVTLLVEPRDVQPILLHKVAKMLLPPKDADRAITSIHTKIALPNSPDVMWEGIFSVKLTYLLPKQGSVEDPVLSTYLQSVHPLANPPLDTPQEIQGVVPKSFLDAILLRQFEAVKLGPLKAVPTLMGWLISGVWETQTENPRPLLKRVLKLWPPEDVQLSLGG